jgi:hypothetical protein
MWTTAGKEKKDKHVTQGGISAMIDESKRHKL